MSYEMTRLIVGELGLDEQSKNILLKNIKSLNREERKHYYKYLKPREKMIKEFFSQYYHQAPLALKYRIVSQTVDSMLEKMGDPDLVDSIVMNAVGRMLVYKRLREKAEKEGVRLNALNSFGGFTMVILIMVVLLSIIFYFRYM